MSLLTASAVLVARDAWWLIAERALSGADGGMALLAIVGAAWLLWRGRSRLSCGPGPHSTLLLPLLAAVALLLGLHGDLLFVEQAGALLLAPAVALSWLRSGATVVVLRAWVALLFALPVPGLIVETIAIPLQFAEARLVELVALAAGFDVARDGVLVELRGTPVRIDEGCSGFALLWPAVLAVWVAVSGARVDRVGPGIRALAFALAVPVALLANLLRIVCSVFAYAYVDQALAGGLHDLLGWLLVVAVGLVPFVLLGVLDERESRQTPTRAVTLPDVPRLAPLAVGTAALVLAVAAGPEPVGAEESEHGLARRLEALPWRLDQWVGAERALPPREAELLGADAVVHRGYVDLASGEELLLVAAWHRDVAAAAGHGAEKCYRVRGWQLEEAAPVAASAAGDRTQRLRFRRGNTRITVYEAVLDAPRSLADPLASGSGRLRILLVREGVRDDALTTRRFVEALGLFSVTAIEEESV